MERAKAEMERERAALDNRSVTRKQEGKGPKQKDMSPPPG